MEKIFIKNSRNLNLAADLYKSDSDTIIIMCHGFGYDRHEKENKFDKIAEGFYKAGYNILKFDFSGVGESDDDTITVGKQSDDLKSVIKFVKEKGYKNIILFGVSLGTLAILNNYNSDISAIIGVGPVTDSSRTEWPQDTFSKEQLDEIEQTGKLIFKKPSGPRDFVVLDKQYIDDRLSVDQEKLLSVVDCPVFIMHSDGDEHIPLQVSEKAVQILKNGELYVIENGTHGFLESVDLVIEKSLSWLKDKNL